jgi:hypothetical protein
MYNRQWENSMGVVTEQQSDGTAVSMAADEVQTALPNAPEISLEELLEARSHAVGSTVGEMFFSLEGLVLISRSLGVELPEDFVKITTENISEFEEACVRAFQSQNADIACLQMIVVAYGELAIQKGELPELKDGFNKFESSALYLMSLQSVAKAYDNALGSEGFRATPDGQFLMAFTPSLEKNLEAALRFRETLIENIRAERGGICPVAGDFCPDVSILLEAGVGAPIAGIKAVISDITALRSNELMAERPLKAPSIGSSYFSMGGFNFKSFKLGGATVRIPSETGQSEPDFCRFLFPADKYPNRAVVQNAMVTELTCVAPALPGSEAVLYRLIYRAKSKECVQIVTGDTCHTQGFLIIPDAGIIDIGVPNRASNSEVFFEGRLSQAAGPERIKEINEIGMDAASTVVFIAYPMIPQNEADVLKAFCVFSALNSETDSIKRETEFRRFIEICAENGFPAEAKVDEWLSLDLITAGEYEAIGTERIKPPKSTDGSLFDFSNREPSMIMGGSAMKSFRGGRGDTLLAGASSKTTGRRYVGSTDEVDIDPTVPPKIFCIKVIAVSDEGMEA